MSKGIFITGTGTDVGKTYVTALLVKRIKELYGNVAYYKAAMSGNVRDEKGALIPGDAKHVKDISGIEEPLSDMCPYIYETAVSPHLASRLEGNPVQLSVVKQGYEKVSEKYNYVVMEGSGGILCPICFDEAKIQLEDIVRELKLNSIIVADAGLGTINSVVLTWYYMKEHNLPIKGVIFNNFHKGDVMEEDNVKMCEYMTGLPTIAFIAEGAKEIDISKETVNYIFEV